MGDVRGTRDIASWVAQCALYASSISGPGEVKVMRAINSHAGLTTCVLCAGCPDCVRVCIPFVVEAHSVHELEGVVYRRETAGMALTVNGTYGVIP